MANLLDFAGSRDNPLGSGGAAFNRVDDNRFERVDVADAAPTWRNFELYPCGLGAIHAKNHTKWSSDKPSFVKSGPVGQFSSGRLSLCL